jgi:glycosyltransferase involved in cell wall biosynthesis
VSAHRAVRLAPTPELMQPPPAHRLRVLTLTPFYPSHEHPTEGCFVAEVLPWTERLAIENHVIAVRPFYRGEVRALDSEVPCSGRTYLSIPGNAGLPSAGILLASTLIRFLHQVQSKHRFDLIHAHAALPCGHAASIASRKLGIPFVVTAHGLDVFSDRQAKGSIGRWCRRISEQVYRQAGAVVCVSEAVQQQLGRMAGRAKVIHNAVDTFLFSPGPEQHSPLVVLSIGNLIPTKGHALLLRAFAHVVSQFSDCQLQVIGDGPERKTLVHLAGRLGITDRVHFRGRQDRATVAQAMKGSAIFALSSSYEGLGCVYLEAMASGKPVIGCDGQGIAEIIQHGTNGLLVNPESEAQLSDALLMLLQNPELRRRIGKAAYDTILQRHTIAHQAEELGRLYRECVV